MSALDIFFPVDNSKPVQGRYYATVGSAPDTLGDKASIRELIQNPAFGLHEESVRIFIPGEWVSLHQTELPGRGKKQAEKILPALLEDEVGENIESLHFALFAFEDERAIVAVIHQQKMQQITHWMQASGIRSRTVLPDWMAQACGTLLIQNDRCLLRTTPWLGWSSSQALAPTLLAAQLPLSVQVFYRDELPAELASLLNTSDAISLNQQLPAPRADMFTASLLWGKWKPRTDYRQQWQRWRNICYAIAAGLLLLTLERGISLWSIHSQVQQSRQQLEQRFQQLFPAQKRIVNLRAQINSALQNSGQQLPGEEVFTLLPQVAATLTTFHQQADVVSLKIDQQQQSISLQLRVANYDSFALLHEAFAKAFQVKENNVQNEDSYVVLGFTLGRK